MATAYTQEHGEDNFVLELNRLKEKVRTTLVELRECLSVREDNLMKELNDILSCYLSYKTEVKKIEEQKQEIENIRNANLCLVTTSPAVKSIHDKILQDLNVQLELLKFPVKPKLVRFVCDKNQLISEVNKLCKLVESMNEIDYASKTQPIISVGDRGTGDEQLYNPYGVAVDHNTGNIYVADISNQCVKVFDRTCKYLFKFGHRQEMIFPRGIDIRDNRVLITQSDSCIMLYQLDGKFISRVGTKGTGELQFRNPLGLSTDNSNGDIYVCDYFNHRIQIISENFQFKSQFGNDILHFPTDVKLYEDNIFILDKSNPCMHIYNRDLVLHKSVISRGIGQQVYTPYFFFIDKIGNILISDNNSILILNSRFEFVHKIPVRPFSMGISVDKEDRIIVVARCDKHCLQIY